MRYVCCVIAYTALHVKQDRKQEAVNAVVMALQKAYITRWELRLFLAFEFQKLSICGSMNYKKCHMWSKWQPASTSYIHMYISATKS